MANKKKATKSYYYKLDYFKNRKDNGSFYIKTDIKGDPDIDFHDIVFAAYDQGAINPGDDDYITEIEKITKKEFLKKTKEN